MDAPSTCVTGCTVRGQHYDDCPDDDTCRGCYPAAATRGLACDRCFADLGAALTLAPALVAHLRTLLAAGGAGPPRTGRIASTTGEAPVPLAIAAVDAADLLYALLAADVEHAADSLRLTGPTRPTAWRTMASRGDVVGLRAGASGAEAAVYATWLHRHLDAVVELDWVAGMLTRELEDGQESLVHAVRRIERAWPLEERPTRLEPPCPVCGWQPLMSYPPAFPGLPITIRCTAPDCGAAVLEEELPVITKAALWRAEQDRDEQLRRLAEQPVSA